MPPTPLAIVHDDADNPPERCRSCFWFNAPDLCKFYPGSLATTADDMCSKHTTQVRIGDEDRLVRTFS